MTNGGQTVRPTGYLLFVADWCRIQCHAVDEPIRSPLKQPQEPRCTPDLSGSSGRSPSRKAPGVGHDHRPPTVCVFAFHTVSQCFVCPTPTARHLPPPPIPLSLRSSKLQYPASSTRMHRYHSSSSLFPSSPSTLSMRSSKLSLSSGAGSVSRRLAMYGYALASSLYCSSKYGNKCAMREGSKHHSKTIFKPVIRIAERQHWVTGNSEGPAARGNRL